MLVALPVKRGGPLNQMSDKRIREDREREKAKAETARKAAEQQTVIDGIRKTMTEAGYEVGTKEADWVLAYAQAHRLKIDDAIVAHKAYEQSIVDRYVSGKKAGPKKKANSTKGPGKAGAQSSSSASTADFQDQNEEQDMNEKVDREVDNQESAES